MESMITRPTAKRNMICRLRIEKQCWFQRKKKKSTTELYSMLYRKAGWGTRTPADRATDTRVSSLCVTFFSFPNTSHVEHIYAYILPIPNGFPSRSRHRKPGRKRCEMYEDVFILYYCFTNEKKVRQYCLLPVPETRWEVITLVVVHAFTFVQV